LENLEEKIFLDYYFRCIQNGDFSLVQFCFVFFSYRLIITASSKLEAKYVSCFSPAVRRKDKLLASIYGYDIIKKLLQVLDYCLNWTG